MNALNFEPLTELASSQDVSSFRRSHSGALTDNINLWVFAVISLGVAVTAAVIYVKTGAYDFTIALIVVAVILAILTISQFASQRIQWRRWFRLNRFATANDLAFEINPAVPAYPGMIFQIGNARVLAERVSRLDDPFLDIGQYKYTTGSGKNKTTHRWTYLAVHLDRHLPQIVLDSRENNFLTSNLPVKFSHTQELELEGDFNKFFRLYCPNGYETDALYLLTPDLMKKLIDKSGNFDVEIVDNWMFFYSTGFLDLSVESVLSHIFDVARSVGRSMISKSERYADSRVDSQIVANTKPAQLDSEETIGSISQGVAGTRLASDVVGSGGRRLKTATPWAGLGIVVAIVVAWFFLR